MKVSPHDHPSRIISSRTDYAIRRVRRLHERAERDRIGLHYTEGMRCLARAIRHGAHIETLVTCPTLLTHGFARRLARWLRQAGTPVLEVTPEVLASLSLVDDPQGLGAVVRQRWTPLARLTPTPDATWLMLDTVRSPGNLGTTLRTAEAVGAQGAILLGDAVDPYDPATVRASMGALFSQRFVRTSLPDLARWRRAHPCLLVGSSPTASVDYQAIAYRGPTLLVLGGERKGLAPDLLAACDVVVRIPMVGETDSLNLSVAASLLLYEVFNQRRTH
jgi:TrmH family RNA methyltransferase